MARHVMCASIQTQTDRVYGEPIEHVCWAALDHRGAHNCHCGFVWPLCEGDDHQQQGEDGNCLACGIQLHGGQFDRPLRPAGGE